jgi:hypothetical protein
MLDTGKAAARQYDKLEAEDAILALDQCVSVLTAVVCASDDLSDNARNGALDLVADVLRQRGAELRRFYDAVVSAECPEVVVQYHARQPEPAAVDLAA